MAYLNGNRVFMKAAIIDTDNESYEFGYENGYAEGYTKGETAGYATGQQSVGTVARVTGDTAVCEYVHPTEHDVKVQLETKNLLPYPFYHKTRTQNGITFTDNGDGTVTVNGTASGSITTLNGRSISAEFILRHAQPYPELQRGETAYLSGCPAGGSANTYFLRDVNTGHEDRGAGTSKLTHYSDGAFASIKILIVEGTVCDNVVFKPMITRSKTAYADWTPYMTDFSGIPVLCIPAEGESQLYTAKADGSVPGVKSAAPSMTIGADLGTLVTAEYYLDAARKLEDMGVTLLNLGGSL